MPEQQQSGQDNSLDFLWIVAVLIGVVVVVWYFGKVYISSAILTVRLYEILAINFVGDYLIRGLHFIGLPAFNLGLGPWIDYIHSSLGSSVGFQDLVAVSNVAGKYLRYPLGVFMILGAVSLYFGGVTYRFRNTYSIKSLRKLEQENWPQITPVVDLDLVNQKLDDAPWAMALSPMVFCKQHDLLDVTQTSGVYSATLRRGSAHRILSLQLGPKWSGVGALPIYLKALFAIFAARIAEDKPAAEQLLDQISVSAKNTNLKTLDFSGVDPLIKKHINHKKVVKLMSLHGYVTTLLAAMLIGAREVGVIATSEFIWLKPIDRRMWYMLNSVGRPTAVAEICGAFAHWLAEKRLGLPLLAPMVDEAVKGLEIALGDILYKPDEE